MAKRFRIVENMQLIEETERLGCRHESKNSLIIWSEIPHKILFPSYSADVHKLSMIRHTNLIKF